jgi:HD-GYP domain-containing protein (c-di-GMP phosphodiesterase class II)
MGNEATPDIDALALDSLIESYDVQNDPLLEKYFRPIEKELWSQIENYGEEINEYGAVLSKHLVRTSAIGMYFLTDELGFSEKAGRNFYDANLLQDLGKTHDDYDVDIWALPHRPSEKERVEKRKHAMRGVEILEEAIKDCPDELKQHPHIEVIKAIQLFHHERIDGSGQFGLKGPEMGKVIKAICIIDAFDGDMIHRPHQRAKRTPEEALERMESGQKYENAFDAGILQRFIDFQLPES